jgi:hypothetical protein
LNTFNYKIAGLGAGVKEIMNAFKIAADPEFARLRGSFPMRVRKANGSTVYSKQKAGGNV